MSQTNRPQPPRLVDPSGPHPRRPGTNCADAVDDGEVGLKVVVVKSDLMSDWYLIRCSSRFSDADVGGRASEMRNIAVAIERGVTAEFYCCAVDATRDPVRFWSPRNSNEHGKCSKEEAKALAKMIREIVK